jgi:hypothetical protein
MPLQIRAALRRFVADSLSWRRAALNMILMLACWSGEGFAQKVLSVTPTDCKYKFSPNPQAAGPDWAQPGFDDSGWVSSLPAAVSYLPPGPYPRDAKGELLGFECMAALTSKPAAEVADAAQKWGQEDDITVLTVTSGP